MPDNGLGYSFAPTFDNAEAGRRGGSPATQAQSPLQVLSFNLPKFKGAAGGLSPLQGTQQAGSSIGQAVLESVFKTVLGNDAPAVLDQLSGGSAPSPVDAFQPPARVPVDVPPPVAIDTGRVGDTVRGPAAPVVKPNPPVVREPQRPAAGPEPPPVSRPAEPERPFAPPEPDPVFTAPPARSEPPPPVFVPGDDTKVPVSRDGGGEGVRTPVNTAPAESEPPRFRIPTHRLPSKYQDEFDLADLMSPGAMPPAFSRMPSY